MTDPSASITLEPNGMINSDGNYLMQDQGLYDLLNYVWTGVMLATTKEAYMNLIKIRDDDWTRLQPLLDPLLKFYAEVS
jgi:hypothetical protein